MTPKAECINPTMKQSLALFLSVLNFFKKNTNDVMTGLERLCIGILEMVRVQSFTWYRK